MRLLDKAGIAYQAVSYGYEESDLSAINVAEAVGVPVRMLFKTLVLRGEPGGIFVCMVSGDSEVDLKKAAAASGNKRAAMVAVRELLPLTGYVRGGCSPVGMKKPYPIYIDTACKELEHIFISAGRRGMQLKIKTSDLIGFTGALPAELV